MRKVLRHRRRVTGISFGAHSAFGVDADMVAGDAELNATAAADVVAVVVVADADVVAAQAVLIAADADVLMAVINVIVREGGRFAVHRDYEAA